MSMLCKGDFELHESMFNPELLMQQLFVVGFIDMCYQFSCVIQSFLQHKAMLLEIHKK